MAIHQYSLTSMGSVYVFLELSKHKIYENILMMLVLTTFKYKQSCFIEIIVGNKFCRKMIRVVNFRYCRQFQ